MPDMSRSLFVVIWHNDDTAGVALHMVRVDRGLLPQYLCLKGYTAPPVLHTSLVLSESQARSSVPSRSGCDKHQAPSTELQAPSSKLHARATRSETESIRPSIHPCTNPTHPSIYLSIVYLLYPSIYASMPLSTHIIPVCCLSAVSMYLSIYFRHLYLFIICLLSPVLISVYGVCETVLVIVNSHRSYPLTDSTMNVITKLAKCFL